MRSIARKAARVGRLLALRLFVADEADESVKSWPPDGLRWYAEASRTSRSKRSEGGGGKVADTLRDCVVKADVMAGSALG